MKQSPSFRLGTILSILITIILIGENLYGQDQKEKPDTKKSKLKPFEEVITKDAKSTVGVFTVHKVENKWYYEIPKNEIGKLFLWVSQIKKTQAKLGYGGVSYDNQVVRWDRNNDQILLRQIQYALVADENKAVYNGVDASNFPPILMAFDIVSFGKDSSVVIDVTDFFVADKQDFTPKKNFKAKRLDTKRSYIEKITAYQQNVEADVVLTFEADEVPGDHEEEHEQAPEERDHDPAELKPVDRLVPPDAPFRRGNGHGCLPAGWPPLLGNSPARAPNSRAAPQRKSAAAWYR
jgi:hypothetical protein